MGLRVFELAKELNIPSKDLLKKLQDSGISATSIFSGLKESELATIKKQLLQPSTRIEEGSGRDEKGEKRAPRRIISHKIVQETQKIRRKLRSRMRSLCKRI